MTAGWNRNIHYHDLILQAIPAGCGRALDVGCGRGILTGRLANRCEQVVGIDVDCNALTRARSTEAAGVTFIDGDVMTYPFDPESFDLITAVAVLHHLPLRPALARFSSLLRRGGLLAIVGLHHEPLIQEYAQAAVVVPLSWMYRWFHGTAEVGAPIADPVETLDEIRHTAVEMLPGMRLKRLLLFRYSLCWRKP